jgi:hypothetical protein
MGKFFLTKTLLKVEEFTWIVAFQVRGEVHDRVRPGHWKCGWCRHEFAIGEMMYLAGRARLRNTLLCADHARDAREGERR